MKNNYAIAIFFVAGFFVHSLLYAQKISFQTIKFKHIQLPLDPLGDHFKTCRSEVTIALPENLQKDASLKNLRINLKGFQSVSRDKKADLRTSLKFGDFGLVNKRRIKDEVYHINTGSNETGYYDVLTFDYPAELMVSTWDYKVLLHREIHPDSAARILNFGKWTFSEEELSNKLEQEEEQLRTDIQKKCVQSVMRMARDLVNSQYGYPLVTEHLKIAVVKSKKNSFYSDLKQAEVYMENAFAGSKEYNVTPASEQSIEKSLKIWENILHKADADSKGKVSHEMKLTLLTNAAQGYLWIDKFEEAGSWIDRAKRMVTKDTPKKYRNLIVAVQKTISDRKERFMANR